MFSVYEAPADATGTFDPKWQQYKLTQVLLTENGAETSTNLLTGDPVTLKIIDRSQRIFEGDLKDYVDTTFSDITLVFESEVVNYSGTTESTLTLADPLINLHGDLLVETGKELAIYVKVKWRNTVTKNDDGTESVSLPEFEISRTLN